MKKIIIILSLIIINVNYSQISRENRIVLGASLGERFGIDVGFGNDTYKNDVRTSGCSIHIGFVSNKWKDMQASGTSSNETYSWWHEDENYKTEQAYTFGIIYYIHNIGIGINFEAVVCNLQHQYTSSASGLKFYTDDDSKWEMHQSAILTFRTSKDIQVNITYGKFRNLMIGIDYTTSVFKLN